jgi:hypothetical protein
MPNNRVNGILEDFVRELIPLPDTLLGYVKLSVAGIPAAERRFSDTHVSKAIIHTWLAWQEDPGTPMGLALTKRYIDAHSPYAAPFLQWVTQLFNPADISG